jgi:rare lipoprotein A
MAAYLARTGLAVFALLFSLTVLTEHVAAGRALIASTALFELPELREIATVPSDVAVAYVAAAGFETAVVSIAAVPDASASLLVVDAAPLAAAPAVPVPTVPAIIAASVEHDAVVLASWYGPGFYGNRTACGQTYTPEIVGAAHLTLPCGTPMTLTYRDRSITVPVIDRGPYVAGRALDLSNAARLALGCADLCTLRMQLAR